MATSDESDLQFEPGELPPGLTAEQVRTHVIAPEHTRAVHMEQVDPAKERRMDVRAAMQIVPPSPGGVAHVSLGAFAAAIHTALRTATVGYELGVRKNGAKVLELAWNWAQTPTDDDLGWNENRRMHIAGVSKLLTAVAMVKALDDEGISHDATIGPYLPSYWSQGQNIGKITFRHLMTHTSGFSTGSSRTDFAFMKAKVAAGVTTTPGSATDPENMNFGLCRILIPIVTGAISKNATWQFTQDVMWDAVTIAHFKTYTQSNIFTPAGIPHAGWAPAAGGALAYRQPHAARHGWSSGNLETVAGSDGWRLSVKELLEVLNHVRRQSTIVSPQTAQTILDSRFGIDAVEDTPAGRTYAKSGYWGSAGRVEQCGAFLLPEGLEAVLFVNSPIGTDDSSLRGLVQGAYERSLSAWRG